MAIAEATIETYIRARGISTSDVSDSDLDTLILMALDEYSTYRPYTNFTTTSGYLTTVDGQADYTYPTGAISILNVFWQPDYADDAIGDVYTDMLLKTYNTDHPIDLTIYYNQLAEMRYFFAGRWKDIGGKIFLVPPPTISGTKVAVLYATKQTVSTLNAIDDYLFMDLVYAYCSERKAMLYMESAGFRAGSYSVTPDAGQALMKFAELKMTEVRQRLSALPANSTQYVDNAR
ncbi:MAG: hypothetical protein BWY74_01046 [Firmicutes bacterium ADurb.Bin419]|nr:MAG: hypothetical protein BWY74_01046 [Firmicutes bacterium ADurb.Bin419]